MKTLLLAALLLPLSLASQISLHTEARFHGLAKCPSLVAWVHSDNFEVWTRTEIYPQGLINSTEYPVIQHKLGGTALAGIGFSEVKFMAGFQNGQFIKGLHMNSESDDGRFWYNVLFIHRPPMEQDEFRLDGEFDFQGYSKPLNKETNRRTRVSTETSLGAMLRMECYEPVPHAIHTGIAFRKITNKGASSSQSGNSSSDFHRSLDGKAPKIDMRNSSTSVITLISGPSYFIHLGWGFNVALRWTM